jgi:hypothetical protein
MNHFAHMRNPTHFCILLQASILIYPCLQLLGTSRYLAMRSGNAACSIFSCNIQILLSIWCLERLVNLYYIW